MNHLRYFKVVVDIDLDCDNLCFLIRSLLFSLASHAILEHIELKISFRSYHDHLNYYGLFEGLRGVDFWNHLDSITAHPIGSRLQRVDINIEVVRYGRDEDELMDGGLSVGGKGSRF
jgi:hypothetical protein